MRLIDWREASPAALNDVWREQVTRWNERLSWDSAGNWAEVEIERRAGRLPGLILLDDQRVYGWTFFLVHRDTLQIGGFEADSSSSTRTLLDAVLATGSPSIAPEGVMLFAFSAAPGLVPALVARGFDIAPYRYLVRDVADAHAPNGTMPWTVEAATGLPRLLAHAYGEPELTRPFARQGTEGEWREYAGQLLGSAACGTFDARLSAARFAPDGSLAGAIVTTVVGPATAHIAQVVVSPDQRGKGTASALLHEVIARTRQAGLERVSLLVSEHNAGARRLYQRAGFGETASFVSAGRRPTIRPVAVGAHTSTTSHDVSL